VIYDYLFFKSYQLAKRSKNFDDAPVLGGIWGVIPCFMFTLFTVMFLIDGFFKSHLSNSTAFIKQFKYIFAGLLICALLLYFRRNQRWKKIIARYEDKEAKSRVRIHAIVVLVITYVFSFVLLLLAGMYKNGDGIFK